MCLLRLFSVSLPPLSPQILCGVHKAVYFSVLHIPTMNEYIRKYQRVDFQEAPEPV